MKPFSASSDRNAEASCFRTEGSTSNCSVSAETISSMVFPSHSFQISAPRMLSDSMIPSAKRTAVPTSATSLPLASPS